MAHDAGTTDEGLANLVLRSADANAAFVRGDIEGYLALVEHADDYTLMAPFDWPPTRGFDASPEPLAELARHFRDGTLEQEPVQSYASGDLAVLVTVERQRDEVGGLPEQDLDAASHPGLPARRVRVAAGAPARRPAREQHRRGTGGGAGPRRLTRRPGARGPALVGALRAA